MSAARAQFLENLAGIREAISLDVVAQGSGTLNTPPSVSVLRRGILVAGLIALETFVRDRTEEALTTLARWPRPYEELPEKLRLSARLNALSHLQQFAKVLKRQGDDYETELANELRKMAGTVGGGLQFTKYVAGDYTGNLSDTGLKELLSSLQVDNCWATFRTFASDVGLGVPSVHEIVKSTVRKRHRSAHVARYAPAASDISELPSDLLCVAMCFDVSVSASMEAALAHPAAWAAGDRPWAAGIQLWLMQPYGTRFRVRKHNAARALRVIDAPADGMSIVPRAQPGEIAVLVQQDSASRPTYWTIL